MQNSKMTTTDPIQKRMNLFRYGLMVIPPVAFVVALAVPFMVYYGLGSDMATIFVNAILPAILWAIGAAILCVIVWYGYKRFIIKM